jgi:hypothetical protein
MKLKIYYLAAINLFMAMSLSFTTQAQPALQTPVNNTLGYSYSKITYTWDTVSGATSYDLYVCNDTVSSTYTKIYSGSITNTYTPASDYLAYNTKYYWRVRAKVGTVLTPYSSYFTFTIGAPSDSIGIDPNASVAFDHTTGRVTQIIYKGGSNSPLLNSSLNDKAKIGLGRINNETGTRLSSWSESPGNYVYNYDNSIYGSKTLTINWTANGIIVTIAINLAVGKAAVLNAAWQPGGDTGPLHDYVLYAPNASSITKTNLLYPGSATTLYLGNTILTAMTDDRYSEYFGFKSASPVQTSIQQSLSFGPTYSYASAQTVQTITLSFAAMKKTNFFTWSGGRYIIVNTPVAGSSILDQSSNTIKWETFGLASNLNIKLSIDGGATMDTVMAAATPDDSIQVVTFPYLAPWVPLNNCLVQVSAGAVSGNSGIFSVVSNASSVFSISNTLTGAPTDTVLVPIMVSPAAGDSIYAFDMRLYYSKDIISFSKSYTDPSLANWSVGVTNNSTGYLQIGGFNSTGLPITSSDTVVSIKFVINPNARVGLKTNLVINNSFLSAANSLAQPMPVSGVDGVVTLYTRTSGFIRYIISKRPITGTTMLTFIDTVAADTTFGNSDINGYFNFSNQTPGSIIKLAPIGNLNYPALITDAVNAVDAAKAFAGRDGGPTPLSPLQMVVADINRDGKLNSTDSYAILKISTGALTAASFGQTNWVFIDSNYNITATNWALAPQNKIYLPLDSVNARQSFWGAIRGDVDGGYNLPGSLNKSSAISNIEDPNAVTFSVPANMNVRPGDTLSLPLDIKLNGKKVGAFNTSIQFDKNMVSYTGVYNESSSLPSGKGWAISTHFDGNGKFNIGAADFADSLAPISTDGPIAVFKFVVNNQAQIGDTSQVSLSGFAVADSKLNQLAVNNRNGKVTVATITTTNNNNLIYEYSLAQNYPNPFNPTTTIAYSLKNQSNVVIEIYNAIGQRVSTIFNGAQAAGYYKMQWSAKGFASGIYFYRIKAGEFTQVKKMVLLK